MILFDMDYPTIFRQMFAESEKIEFYLQKKLEKVTTLKAGHYLPPNIFYDLVTLPKSNNTYLLYWLLGDCERFYFDDNKSREKNMCCGSVLLVPDKRGQQYGMVYKRYKMFFGETAPWVDGLTIFTPHFYSRYRERFGLPPDMKTIDCLVTFSARNLNYFQHLNYNDFVLEKDRQENGAAISIKDGVILGELMETTVDGKKLMITKAKTYLKDKNLKVDQAELNPTHEETLRWAKEAFKKFNGYDIETIL